MSCWWDIDISAIGAEPIVQELREKISYLEFEDGARLFHHVEVVKSAPGLVLVHASRNYRGEAAICELIALFPDLTFQGSLWSDVGSDQFTLFEGRQGETILRNLVIPDFEEHLARVPDRVEIEKQIAELDEKIGGPESERDHLKHYLARPPTPNSGKVPLPGR